MPWLVGLYEISIESSDFFSGLIKEVPKTRMRSRMHFPIPIRVVTIQVVLADTKYNWLQLNSPIFWKRISFCYFRALSFIFHYYILKFFTVHKQINNHLNWEFLKFCYGTGSKVYLHFLFLKFISTFKNKKKFYSEKATSR